VNGAKNGRDMVGKKSKVEESKVEKSADARGARCNRRGTFKTCDLRRFVVWV
jgi:hypothetical protein